jgi:RHH-type rel operon transcriptional repressor/antitoxin RelB
MRCLMSVAMNVRISEKLDSKLQHLVEETGRTKSYYIRKAVESFMEDREDYLLAVARLEEGGPTSTLEEVIKELGMADNIQSKGKK